MARPKIQLKRRLRRLHITQDAIAARAGVTRTYVNHYLSGRRAAPRVERAIVGLIAEATARKDAA